MKRIPKKKPINNKLIKEKKQEARIASLSRRLRLANDEKTLAIRRLEEVDDMLRCSVEPCYHNQSLLASVRYDRVQLRERFQNLKKTTPDYGVLNYHMSKIELDYSRDRYKFISMIANQIAEQIYEEIDNDH